ncbi:MAG: sigma 54-interacting transcriptional regulator [Clostridiales bacterium]|nr:sigma 54-interacting transcriptional regulator [Clostridiales bacterium]
MKMEEGLMVLQRVGPMVQQIAEAIAATVNCHVTIIDANLVRVAGTGPYEGKVRRHIPQGSVFIKVLKRKETIVIENPGHERECWDCSAKDDCIETYEICTPILWKDKAMGVIGIFAFDEKQREYLKEKKEDLLNFLEKMSQLIASKIGETILYEKIDARNKELDAVIQNVHQGIICITSKGNVSQINAKAVELLGLSKPIDELQGINLREIWANALILKSIEENKEYIDREEYFEGQDFKKGLLTTVKLICQGDNLIGAVGSFTDLENIQRSAYKTRENHTGFSLNNLIGVSSKIMEVKERTKKVANYDSTVLITGESGTGKEVFARAIHDASQRADYPFIGINCSAIPESLLESELFGYEPGAFTGASKKGKAGKMELANKGTFFLDEIGDMPLFLQAKLLRVLQDKKVTRIGGLKPKELDIRIIAATNKDLRELIKKRMFREDLYYRLNVIPIALPPLRERLDDIPILAEYFLRIYNERFQKNIKGFTSEAMAFLMSYPWPGNVRELENIVEYGINFAENDYISIEDIKDRFENFIYTGTKSLKEMVQEYEYQVINKYLEKFGNTDEGRKKTSEILGISRATLYRKLSQS